MCIRDRRSSIEDFGADDMSGAQARLDSLLCSAALCGRADGRVRLLCVNEYYLRMMRGERETFEEVDAQLERWAGPQAVSYTHLDVYKRQT